MEDVMVEAIDGGKIVKVSEYYAKREGLPIIRRPEPRFKAPQNDAVEDSRLDPSRREKKGILKFDDFRRPLRSKNQVEKELVDNFHWVISRRRKELDMTRKVLAEKLEVDERVVVMLERGILLKDDFVLINKVQQVLGVNLRKDQIDFSASPRKGLDEKRIDSEGLDLSSRDEIELLDE